MPGSPSFSAPSAPRWDVIQGALSSVPAPRLGAVVVRAAVERAGLTDLAAIDEVLMGNVVSAGLGQAPARQAAIFAGLPSHRRRHHHQQGVRLEP